MAASLDTLTPDTRERVEELLRLAEAAGLDARVVSTRRSCAQQAAIYAQGRTAPGAKISGARGCRSWHVWGRAADFAIFDEGKPVWNARDPRYQQLGALGRQAGLSWPLPSRDPGHFQNPSGLSIRTLCPDPDRCEELVGEPTPPPEEPLEPVDLSPEPSTRPSYVLPVLGGLVLGAAAFWYFGRR